MINYPFGLILALILVFVAIVNIFNTRWYWSLFNLIGGCVDIYVFFQLGDPAWMVYILVAVTYAVQLIGHFGVCVNSQKTEMGQNDQKKCEWCGANNDLQSKKCEGCSHLF